MLKFPLTRFALIAPSVFLFILPITHTTALRHLCLLLSVIVMLWVWKRNAPLSLPGRFSLWAIGFWFCVGLMATLISIDFEYSQGEFRNEVIYTLLAFGVFYVLTDSIQAWKRWRAILLIACLLMSLLCLTSFYRYGDFVRDSLIGDRNAYSTYIVLIYPFLLLLVATRPEQLGFNKVWVYLAIVLSFVTGALSLNRNMWFGLAAQTLLFILLFLFHPQDRRKKPVKRLGFLAVAGLIIFAGIFTLVDREKNVVTTSGGEQVQTGFMADPRLEIWKYAARHIADHPWLGHGYGRGILRKDFRTHFDDPLKWHGHNIVLNYGLEAGIFGMVSILLLFAALYDQCWKIYRHRDLAISPFGAWGLTMLIGISIKMMTDDILVRDNALLFWSMLGMIWGLSARQLRSRGQLGEAKNV